MPTRRTKAQSISLPKTKAKNRLPSAPTSPDKNSRGRGTTLRILPVQTRISDKIISSNRVRCLTRISMIGLNTTGVSRLSTTRRLKLQILSKILSSSNQTSNLPTPWWTPSATSKRKIQELQHPQETTNSRLLVEFLAQCGVLVDLVVKISKNRWWTKAHRISTRESLTCKFSSKILKKQPCQLVLRKWHKKWPQQPLHNSNSNQVMVRLSSPRWRTRRPRSRRDRHLQPRRPKNKSTRLLSRHSKDERNTKYTLNKSTRKTYSNRDRK